MSVRLSRQRGSVWYAEGSVTIGGKTVEVPEFSTGCRTRTDAQAVAEAREADIRKDLLEGSSGRARRATIADALHAYLTRPGGVKPHDVARVREFNEMIGARSFSEAGDAWRSWIAQRGGQQAPSSIARWRSTLQAAINHGAPIIGASAIRLPGVRGAAGPERVIYLTPDDRARLLRAYNSHAACPALLLAYQGLRTQEALRLDWRQIDFIRRTLHIGGDQTKTGKGRTIPMHPRVDALLFGLWRSAESPTTGPVFLSSRGRPYADTRGRGDRAQGGNPLSKAHETACAAAGVTGFRVHDWRHDWAARMVMAGVDLLTLARLGGWSSIRMVQRYASVDIRHMDEAIRRLA